jgi:hypothetical protein
MAGTRRSAPPGHDDAGASRSNKQRRGDWIIRLRDWIIRLRG